LKDEVGDFRRGVTLFSNKSATPIFELKDVGSLANYINRLAKSCDITGLN
jgi:hypothetical protein